MAHYLDNNVYGYLIIVCGWIFAIVGLVAIVLRLWSRRLQKQSLMLNDWFAVIALVINFVLISHTTQAVIVYGLGQHARVVGDYNVGQLRKSLLGLKPEWAFANAFVKLSILHLYTVIFPLRRVRIAAHIVMVLAILYSLAAFLEIFLSCFPMPYLWNPAGHPGGFCINFSQAWLAVGITNLIEDVLIILLPLPVLWNLQMNTKRKLGLNAIFSLGIFIIIVTAIRIKVITDFEPKDTSYGLGPIAFWSILEPLLGLTNCCLPVIQPAIISITGKPLWNTHNQPGQDTGRKQSSPCYLNGKPQRVLSSPNRTEHPVTTDHRSQDILLEGRISGRKHETHVGFEKVRHGNKTDIETSNVIIVEQEWEIS